MPSSPNKTRSIRPATVIYDTERSASSSSSSSELAPPDINQVLHRRRPWRRLVHIELPDTIQLPLTCIAIALSAVSANGVYCWPTYGPAVATKLELDGPQAQTIVVGGILGVYLMAAPLGATTDRLGPRIGSLIAAALSALGYLSFAALISTHSPGTPHIHLYLTASYFCVGAATVTSYFSAVTCSSLSFPSHPTIALSLPLSLIGLSSLFLSSFSTLPQFITSQHELNATKFLTFLGILAPAINLFSALFMRVVPTRPITVHLGESGDLRNTAATLDERTPLLIGGPEAVREEVEAMEKGKNVKWTAWGLFRDWEGFWVFGLLIALCIGPAEMILATMGSILTSLLPHATAKSSTLDPINALGLRNKHVRILSLTSTIARLATGLSADYLAPSLVAVPNPRYNPDDADDDMPQHLYIRKRKVRLTRGAFVAICSFVLAAVFAWSAGMLSSESGLWVLSGGVGSLYGALFTLTPAIVSAHFGPTNFGLAWGMISYFSALGSVLFSYLYALVSVAVAERGDRGDGTDSDDPIIMCYGPRCFRSTFWIASGCCVVASFGLAWLGRRWRL